MLHLKMRDWCEFLHATRSPIDNLRSERNTELFFTLSIYRLIQELKASSKWWSLHNPAFAISPMEILSTETPPCVWNSKLHLPSPPQKKILQNSSPRTNSSFPPNSMMLANGNWYGYSSGFTQGTFILNSTKD